MAENTTTPTAAAVRSFLKKVKDQWLRCAGTFVYIVSCPTVPPKGVARRVNALSDLILARVILPANLTCPPSSWRNGGTLAIRCIHQAGEELECNSNLNHFRSRCTGSRKAGQSLHESGIQLSENRERYTPLRCSICAW